MKTASSQSLSKAKVQRGGFFRNSISRGIFSFIQKNKKVKPSNLQENNFLDFEEDESYSKEI